MTLPSQVVSISNNAAEYTITELARLYNITLRTLRFYEDKELITPRRVGTARLYSARDRTRLELVLAGKRLGFSLSEIWELIAARSTKLEDEKKNLPGALLSKKQIESQIRVLEQRRGALDDALGELRRAQARLEMPCKFSNS